MNNKIFFKGIILFVVLTAGCATQRLGQFEDFATAGTGYTEAVIILTEEAGNIAIDADSYLLIKDINNLSETDRTKAYLERTEALESLLLELQMFRVHSNLLKRYFQTLYNLTISDAPSSISNRTEELVENLQKISPSLKDATIGDAPVSDFLTKAVSLSISGYQVKVLEDELNRNAAIIERELDLQHAFLSALSIELESDLKVLINTKEYEEIVKPYIAGNKLSKNWVKSRRDLLSSVVVMGSIDNAKNAAKQLHSAFIALVENKIEPHEFGILFEDLNDMIDLVELVRGNTSK